MSRSLAERAVACKGWRWMDGMRIADFPTFGWKRVTDEDVRARITYRSWLPDLDDPATLGCIEHDLLPAAGYGPDAHLSASSDSKGRVVWYVVYRPDPVSFPGRWLSACEDGSPTKAEALVVALEVE